MNKFIIHMNDVLKRNSLTDFSFGCNKKFISEIVVIAPNWKVDIFNEHSDFIKEISPKVYTVKIKELEFTFIRTGMGLHLLEIQSLRCQEQNAKTSFSLAQLEELKVIYR